MRSTFMGLETSKRGLYTQQSALYTTGHNISNANTPGYSRQRVNMQATAGFPGVGLNTPTMPGFLGTGVEAGSIQRIRDGFVDKQFRDESNKLGYWESQTKAISQMEDVLAEPSKFGLQQSFSDFWQALQTLATNPENGGARAVVTERGVSVADSFNYISNSLTDIQNNLGKEIGVTTKNINSILQQIGELNRQISEVEPNGYMPNDLYDARDNLLDQLSNYVPIEVDYQKSGGRALDIAEGTVTVTIKMKSGGDLKVVQGKEFAQLRTNPNVNQPDDKVTPAGPIQGFYLVKVQGDTEIPLNRSMGIEADQTYIRHDSFLDQGALKSLVNSYGKVTFDASGNVKPDEIKGLYPDMLEQLNTMAREFAKEFNKVHTAGFDKNGEPGLNFYGYADADGNFVEANTEEEYKNITSKNIMVNPEIIGDPNKLAASDVTGEVGNGKNAKALGDVLFDPLGGLNGASIQSYYSGVIGKLGVSGQQAVKMTQSAGTLLGAVSNRRDSISSVSLDEEMTDMIRFQQAYNASARMITVMDETLDKIINGMGVVGR